MKADPLRLASVFHESGTLDAEHFFKCGEKYLPQSKSLWNVLKQEASPASFVDLMLMDIAHPFGGPLDRKNITAELRKALSNTLHLTNDEIKSMLNSFAPPLSKLLDHLSGAAALPEGLARSFEKRKDHLAQAYGHLVDHGYLDSHNFSSVVTQMRSPMRKTNRLMLALDLLRAHNVLEKKKCDTILGDFRADGDEAIPALNKEIIAFIESQPDLIALDVRDISLPETLRHSFPPSFMRHNRCAPLASRADRLDIVVADPFNMALADALSLLSGKPVLFSYAPAHELIARLEEILPEHEPSPPHIRPREAAALAQRRAEEIGPHTMRTVDGGGVRTTVDLVNSVIAGGVRHNATDIHFEPSSAGMRVRIRVDGLLHVYYDIPPKMTGSVISRIKVLSRLNVTERRRSQDGHFTLDINATTFDFRVSTLPTHIGEKIVIRILDERRVMHSLESLGMERKQNNLTQKWIKRPHGLVLVTGPTGSGKSSTLYAALNTLNRETKNIVTIEDPVEYRLEGVNQVQVDSGSELTFASGLRATLRQDPDIIMVGEIRDPETARIALRASLTGHLVLSTLHSNTAAGVIAALRQMGIEPYTITSSLTGVINQRLLRLLCESCKRRFKPTSELFLNLGMKPDSRRRLLQAMGCSNCLNTGYRGRSGVYELMPISRELAQAIIEGKSEARLTEISRQNGHGPLIEFAKIKLLKGQTSPMEIIESFASDEE